MTIAERLSCGHGCLANPIINQELLQIKDRDRLAEVRRTRLNLYTDGAPRRKEHCNAR